MAHITFFSMDCADALVAKEFNVFSYHLFRELDFITAIAVQMNIQSEELPFPCNTVFISETFSVFDKVLKRILINADKLHRFTHWQVPPGRCFAETRCQCPNTFALYLGFLKRVKDIFLSKGYSLANFPPLLGYLQCNGGKHYVK